MTNRGAPALQRALELTRELVRLPTVSRESNHAATSYLEEWMSAHSFETEILTYHDPRGVLKSSIVGRREPGRKSNAGSGGLAYFCHTDVVPADGWVGAGVASTSGGSGADPFEPVLVSDRLYGRGACDMKGSTATFMAAVEQIATTDQIAPISLIATADEEVGFYGAADVAARSRLYRQLVAEGAAGIIGEPTELRVVHAHKGMYVLRATSIGKAAHSSTREGLNANLAMIDFLGEMKRIHEETLVDPEWLDERFDPPWISWNIGINDHTHVVNMTPAKSVCTVSFRPMPGQAPEALVARVAEIAGKCGIEQEVVRRGQPLFVEPQSAFVRSICELAECESSESVSYGTDGTMFTDLAQLVVLGPGSIRQAHTVDEFITLEQLDSGTRLYERLLRHHTTQT
ncbi:MAG: acetylornithine deacetylase [Planctomyces sp.]|nr:acetylornithine deacetylase [Planctomyces sp.]